jgi:ATP-binding cassette subfamily F protein 3
LRNTADELLLVHDGRVEEYEDDLRAYEKWILASYRGGDKPAAPAVTTAPEGNRKEKRQQAAAQREKVRPLQQQLVKTEQAMAAQEQALAALQQQLADPELYEVERKGELATLLKREGELKLLADQLEDRWLELQHMLEQLSG